MKEELFATSQMRSEDLYGKMVEIALSGDMLAAAHALAAKQDAEITRLNALARALEDSCDGKSNAINEHMRVTRALRRKLAVLESEAV